MTDKELIAGLLKGDRATFRVLVDQYQQKVFAMAFSFLKTQVEAEDIAQEVFIEVFQSIKKFRKDAQLSSWIYRITVNKSINRYNKMKRQDLQENMELLLQKNNISEGDPERSFFQKQNAEALYAAVEKLPEKQKVAYTLRHFNGLSYQEIAKVVKKSKSSVESLIHRAHKKMYVLLYEYYEQNLK